MRLKQVGFKRCMVKVVMDDGVEQWMDIVGNDKFNGEAVKKLISSKFKPGDDIKLEYTQTGQDFQVQSVILNGVQPAVTKNPPNSDSKQTTGSVTKKTTYEQASQSTPRNTGESIEKQCAAKATAQVIKALTGRVDENNVLVLIEKIYNKIIDKIQN